MIDEPVCFLEGNGCKVFVHMGYHDALKTLVQSIVIEAAPALVWVALTEFGAGEKWRNADFETDWTIGVPFKITAKMGEQTYQDAGCVLRFDPPSVLEYTHWSRITGLPDTPESRSTIKMSLDPRGRTTLLTVEQQVPPSSVTHGAGWEIGPESGWKHWEFYWRVTLPVLKAVVERGSG